VAHPQIAAFARLANGNAKATREITGQNTLITRNLHDMAYDPIRDEIVVNQFHADAILTFRGGANGNEAPVRIIHGPDTQLALPARVGLDPVHREVFVPEGNQVLVFPSEANGNVAPIRILKGPDTKLAARALSIDPVHNLLFVRGPTADGRTGQILIFNRTDSGNAMPRAVIGGPNAGVSRDGLIINHPPREEIIVGVSSNYIGRQSADSFVGVWSEHDNGDVAPRWRIGGPNGTLRQTRGIAIDPKHKLIMISDKFENAVFSFYFPEIF
jgi:hypothetical protein